jgi:hypothetical protein
VAILAGWTWTAGGIFMNRDERNLFDRSDTDFLEWLFSDHPSANVERQRRRAEFSAWRRAEHEEAWAFVHRIEDDPDAPDDLRCRATAIRSITARTDMRAEVEDAFDDALQVLEDRRQWELHIRIAHGDPTYAYPARYLGPAAADCPPRV